jgi:hypothetical protein
LLAAGATGLVAALVVGIAGWALASRAAGAATAVFEPVAEVVADVADTVEASAVILSGTVEAIESIENATRSAARTLGSVADLVDEAAGLAGGGVADGLDSAVQTLPGLIDTARVIDRTMRALSLVGVSYDPEVPLDESLSELEQSLAPLPDQIRDQVELLVGVREDLIQMSEDGEDLAVILEQTRSDMMAAEATLTSAAESSARAADEVAAIAADIDTYDTLARLIAMAAAIALAAGAIAPLLLGLRYRGVDSE